MPIWVFLAKRALIIKNWQSSQPHDLEIHTWATTVQWAMRDANATSQMILLPGTDYTAVGSYISTRSASALSSLVNLDGSHSNLNFDVHQYPDSDGNGTSSDCASTDMTNLDTLAAWLRSHGRQA